jgi:hypothetical protein
VEIIDSIETIEKFTIVMELIEGTTLLHWHLRTKDSDSAMYENKMIFGKILSTFS